MLILPHYFKDRISFLHGHYYCSFNFHCLLPPWLFIPVPISVWFPLSPLDVFINILWSLLACLRWAPKKLLGSFFRYGVGLIYWWSWMAEPLSVSSSGLTWTALLTRQRSWQSLPPRVPQFSLSGEGTFSLLCLGRKKRESILNHIKMCEQTRHWWPMPVILSIWEAELRESQFRSGGSRFQANLGK
jgi:hypothetical protein